MRHTKIGETTGRTGTKLTRTANGLMRTLRIVLNFARDRDPTVGTNAVSVGLRRSMYMDRRREGHVSEDELAEFWAQAEALPSRTISSFIRLVLATGMRSHECRYLRWEWVGANWITVPAEHTKGKRTLRVPMTTLVRMILAERRALVSPEVPWVFPARVAGRPLQEPKKAFGQITVRRVTPHDLRRTYITMAREAGIKIVQVIGYKNGDCTAVPNAGRLYAWNWENLKTLLG